MSTRQTTQPNKLAIGVTAFAAIMMMTVGVFQAIQGLVALFNDKWTFSFDITTWGWIHLIVGAGVAVAGFFLLSGAAWARVVGIGVAAISAVLNFAWLPYYPVWSMLIIAVDVFVIWALTVHGRDITRA